MFTFELRKENSSGDYDSFEITKNKFHGGVYVYLTNTCGDSCGARFTLDEAMQIASGIKKICEPLTNNKE